MMVKIRLNISEERLKYMDLYFSLIELFQWNLEFLFEKFFSSRVLDNLTLDGNLFRIII